MPPHFIDIVWRGRTVRIEHAWIAPERRTAPGLVFLHQGLGSVVLWRESTTRSS